MIKIHIMLCKQSLTWFWYKGIGTYLFGSATEFRENSKIDNSSTYSSAQSVKWVKNSTSTSINFETLSFRSESKAIRVLNSSTTDRRI